MARMKELDASLSRVHGIMIAGNALRGVGLPDLIRDADRAAQILATD
jgi:protoporphyrinogen oxidase